MKKLLFAAIAVVFLLTACTIPFISKDEETDNGNGTEETNGPTVYSFNFTVGQAVSGDLEEPLRAVIAKRVATYGYENAKVTVSQGKDISVEFESKPGIIFMDNEFIDYMVNTSTFELRQENSEDQLVLSEEEKTALEAFNNEAKVKALDILNQVIAEPDKFAELAGLHSEDPGSKDNGGAYTGIVKGQFVAAYENVIFDIIDVGELHQELVETQFGYHIIKKDGETGEGDDRLIDTSHILITKRTDDEIIANRRWVETGLIGLYIDKVEPFEQEETGYVFQMTFNETGKQMLADLTEENLGKPMAIILDGVLIGAPTISEVLVDGLLVITGNFTQEQVLLVAQRLNSGVLHTRLNLVQ